MRDLYWPHCVIWMWFKQHNLNKADQNNQVHNDKCVTDFVHNCIITGWLNVCIKSCSWITHNIILILMFPLQLNVVFCTHTDAPLVSISHADTMEMVCHADSSPLSNITWSTSGKEVKVCSKSESCPLVVGNVSAGQQITYTCSARNSVGFVEDYITWKVKGIWHVNA